MVRGRFQRDRGEKRARRCINGGGCYGKRGLFVLYPDSGSAAGGDPGLEAHKRAIAARLQLDVYTTNAVAQGLLVQLALAKGLIIS